MSTKKQQPVTHKHTKEGQAMAENILHRKHSAKQTEKSPQKQSTIGGRGMFYRIEVRPDGEFKTFRTHDVGESGHVERLAGKRADGTWDTVTWLVNKSDAHISSNDELVIDDPKARTVLKQIRGKILHKKGNVFEAHLRTESRKKSTKKSDLRETPPKKVSKKSNTTRRAQ